MKKFLLLLSLLLFVLGIHAQTKFARLKNGLTIAFQAYGNVNDPSIILINGTGSPMTDWPVMFCKRLASHGFRVIRFDNRDAGESTRLDSLGDPDWVALAPFIKTCEPAPLPYTIFDMATDVVEFMSALNISRAHIAGVSMGGEIAQLIAIHHPDRIFTLTCIASSSGNPDLPPPSPAAFEAMSTPAPVTKNKDSMMTYLLNIYKALGSTDNEQTLKNKASETINRSWYPEGSARQVAAILVGGNCDRRSQLSTLKIPVMIIQGDSDPLVLMEAAEELVETIPGAELCMIKGMGHDLSIKFIDRIVEAIVKNADR